ncbi:transcriptional antiterminator, bglG family protein [Pullulanibacillus camelliae]|uniref:Transcriptional antiterminator, bglG family protein n=1 Tax=Pullulanibacillus camelliae TaxID=1707096 RepID=A0A8J2VLW1_9BACL|nr:PTS sugar transporter subunit IIA [Pullulanibacillus camelliae]GGE30331.1 transcriptional antiterminator, bglG family protein [Pullulanibacillus camelliae]
MLQVKKEMVIINEKAISAEEAIRKAGKLLVDAGKVSFNYVDAMVKGYKEIGPYIVLGPHIAIPHARPEYGVYEQCLSMVLLEDPVSFGHPTNDPVKLVCAIGGTDNESHINMLRELSTVLGDPEKIYGLMNARDYNEFVSYL